jgi:cytochrome c553
LLRYNAVIIALGLLILAGCQNADDEFASLPAGDVANGEVLYNEVINGAPTCASCHHLDDQRMIGPGLGGYAQVAGERVEGQSAELYTYNSIVYPARYLVDGYQNVMYTEYGTRLSDQQIADLVAYMLTLN